MKSLPELIAEVQQNVRCLDAVAASAECVASQGVLVDVREPGEVANKAVPGSHNIPRGILEMQITTLAPDPGLSIYLHCASGGRARLAAEQLQRMGYARVTAITCALERVCEAFAND